MMNNVLRWCAFLLCLTTCIGQLLQADILTNFFKRNSNTKNDNHRENVYNGDVIKQSVVLKDYLNILLHRGSSVNSRLQRPSDSQHVFPDSRDSHQNRHSQMNMRQGLLSNERLRGSTLTLFKMSHGGSHKKIPQKPLQSISTKPLTKNNISNMKRTEESSQTFRKHSGTKVEHFAHSSVRTPTANITPSPTTEASIPTRVLPQILGAGLIPFTVPTNKPVKKHFSTKAILSTTQSIKTTTVSEVLNEQTTRAQQTTTDVPLTQQPMFSISTHGLASKEYSEHLETVPVVNATTPTHTAAISTDRKLDYTAVAQAMMKTPTANIMAAVGISTTTSPSLIEHSSLQIASDSWFTHSIPATTETTISTTNQPNDDVKQQMLVTIPSNKDKITTRSPNVTDFNKKPNHFGPNNDSLIEYKNVTKTLATENTKTIFEKIKIPSFWGDLNKANKSKDTTICSSGECSIIQNVCKNGATCVKSCTGFSCVCAQGFTGYFCEKITKTEEKYKPATIT